MDTIYKSIHIIDLEQGSVSLKDAVPGDFETYIYKLLQLVLRSDSSKLYSIQDPNTQTIRCIADIIEGMQSERKDVFEDCSASIANKLRRVEAEAQEQIIGTGRKIKRGSIIQALIKDNEQLYYILAKVEYTEWFDGDSLLKSVGFANDEKKIWKTAVIPVSYNDNEVNYGTIHVHTDNGAKYWVARFLEIEEVHSDSYNTQAVFEAIDNVLKRKVKKVSPSDHLTLRSALINTLKKDQHICYPEMVDSLIGINYMPDNPAIEVEKLREELLSLPKKKAFDTDFDTVPSVINERKIKTNYNPMNGIHLVVDLSQNNVRENIRAKYDPERGNVLEITCTDPSVYNAFKETSV